MLGRLTVGIMEWKYNMQRNKIQKKENLTAGNIKLQFKLESSRNQINPQ